MRSTLGAIQIEQGELEAGIDNALQAAHEHHKEGTRNDKRSVASNLASAALGNYRLGYTEDAYDLLAQALDLDDQEEMVKRVQTEIKLPT
jgi:hypothetical protein